jgi:hypothetical protein
MPAAVNPDPSRLLTTAQAGEIALASVWTVERWARDGMLPVTRKGRTIFIDRGDLAEFMAVRVGRYRPLDPLTTQIRQVLRDHADELPEPTDDQIRLIARLLPPAKRRGDVA